MAVEKKIVSYGLREIQLAPIVTDDTAGTEYGELVRAYGAKNASLEPTITEASLTGDDGIVELSSNITGGTFSFEHGVMTLKGIQTVLGGAIEDILDVEGGVAVGQKYTAKNAQELPFFGLLAKTEKSGSMVVAGYKCKATSLSLEFAEEDYCILKVEGSLMRRESDEQLFSISKYDATRAITVDELK